MAKENKEDEKKENKKRWIPASYYGAVMFAYKMINEDNVDQDRAVSIATKYYKKKFGFIEEEKTKEYLLTRMTEKETKRFEEPSVVPEKRSYQYWVMQKCYKDRDHKGKVYGHATVIKAMSRENADIQCKRKDWAEIGSLAESSGYYIEHKLMLGPYDTREEAEAVIAMCH